MDFIKFNKVKIFMQMIIALITWLASSKIYNTIVNKYCITVFEANTGYQDPKLNNYYSHVAKFSIWVPTVILILLSILLFILFRKKYKVFAYAFLMLTFIFSIVSLFSINTNMTRGI